MDTQPTVLPVLKARHRYQRLHLECHRRSRASERELLDWLSVRGLARPLDFVEVLLRTCKGVLVNDDEHEVRRAMIDLTAIVAATSWARCK